MTNGQIADVLEQMADLLEFDGANAFRTRAYRNAARAIRDLTESVETIIEDTGRRLTDVDGIGKSVAEKCEVLVRNGELPQLKTLLQKIPATVLDMLRVQGLGPKKAAVIFRELKVESIDQLKQACLDGRVRVLKGFGEKTEKAILKGVDTVESAGTRIYWAKADDIAQAVRQHLERCEAVDRLEAAGSYRRGKETVGDLDFLVVSRRPEFVMDHFLQYPDVTEVISRGPTKMSVRIRSGLQIDLRVVRAESFGAALQYFTGSKEHNVVLRGLARQRGLKINEYGVFRVDGQSQQYLAGASERDVYDAMELPLFAPELRESRQEFLWAEQGNLPELIEQKDIRGDLHMHTTATDGTASMTEMADAARQRGLQYIAVTDHSQRWMGRGMNPQTLLEQWRRIDQLNEQWEDEFIVLKGIECDILERGGMDLPDDILARADWVLASIHYGQQQSREQINERMMEAIENPHVHAIAHPTGRIIGRRDPYDLDVDLMLKKALEHGKLLELNANPARLDLNDVYCAAACRLGIRIVINSDAHSESGLDVMRYGILQARRAGLTKDGVANTRGWGELSKMLP